MSSERLPSEPETTVEPQQERDRESVFVWSVKFPSRSIAMMMAIDSG